MENTMRLASFFEALEIAVIFFILPAAIFLAAQFLTSYKVKNKLLRNLPTAVAVLLLAGCYFIYLYGIYTMNAETRYFASLLIMLSCFCAAGAIVGKFVAAILKKRKSM